MSLTRILTTAGLLFASSDLALAGPALADLCPCDGAGTDTSVVMTVPGGSAIDVFAVGGAGEKECGT